MDSEASTHNLLEDMLLNTDVELTNLPLSLLKVITNNFSDDLQLGSGGFAVVFKGFLRNGMVVAVKKLHNTLGMDEKKYNEEVGCLIRVKHKNVVRFLGYCADTQGKMCNYGGKFVMADVRQRLLCFEYLPKGSLHDYITDASHGLEWRKRYQIIKGICDGLHDLHETRIVHLDLKPKNILLDDDMEPKIVDFGLSKCFAETQTWVITSKLLRSRRYLAPESYDLVMTFKSDIYSLGVTVLEILTGQKGFSEVEKRSPGHLDTELIAVYPMKLCFPVKPNKHVQCTVSLTNNTEDEVVFLIIPTDRYICVDECYVSPHSTCVLYVAMQEQLRPPPNLDGLKILFMNTWSRNHIPKDLNMMDSHSNSTILLDNLCGQIREKGGEVHNVSLMAVSCNPDTASRTEEPLVSLWFGLYTIGGLKSIDVHPTEPWILTGHARGVCISKKKPEGIAGGRSTSTHILMDWKRFRQLMRTAEQQLDHWQFMQLNLSFCLRLMAI